MKIVLPEHLETEFRKAVAIRLGLKKGNISKAAIEAIQIWLQDRTEEINIENLRNKYPNQYLAISNNRVLVAVDTLDELFLHVADITEKVFIVTPTNKQKAVRLGWRLSAK